MLALANVMKFFANKFARLRGRCLAFARILACPFDGSSFRHALALANPVPAGDNWHAEARTVALRRFNVQADKAVASMRHLRPFHREKC